MKFVVLCVFGVVINFTVLFAQTIEKYPTYELFNVNNSYERIIFTKNNSIITIPAHTFLDSINKPILGTISLYVYEELGSDYYQINLLAEFNNKTAKKDTQKEILIETFNRGGKKVQQYKNSQFTYQKDAEILSGFSLSALSEKYKEYPFNIVYNFDSLCFESRYRNLHYGRTTFISPETKEPYPHFSLALSSGEKGSIWVEMKNMSLELYPEMKSFNGLVWVVTSEKELNAFKESFIKDKEYRDLRLKYDANSKTFIVELKHTTGFVTFSGYPRYPDTKVDISVSKNLYDIRVPEYEEKIKSDEDFFNKNLARETQKYNTSYQRLKDKAMRDLQKTFEYPEKGMSEEEWLRYHHYITTKNSNKDVSIIRFSIKELGNWKVGL